MSKANLVARGSTNIPTARGRLFPITNPRFLTQAPTLAARCVSTLYYSLVRRLFLGFRSFASHPFGILISLINSSRNVGTFPYPYFFCIFLWILRFIKAVLCQFGPGSGSGSAAKVGCPGCKLDEINNNKTGIPYLNFFYIGVICLCSTLPIQSLFPYLYFMIRDLKVAKQEEDIGFYAGFVGASYFITRTISAVPWGIFADKYGRKPCIIISIISVIVFNTLFGLNMTYWMAIVTRALLGLLCGILGPIKAYASEVCRKEHQALGISLITSSWAIAFVVGPAIGGFLSQPAKKYPNVFSHESIFGRFPYFLPCLVISVLATGACVACIWLPETLHMRQGDNMVEIDAMELQVVNSILVGKPKISRSGRFASVKSCLKNWQLMSAIIVYCMFSLYDTAYNEIFSLWAVSSRKYQGLSFTSQDVGIVLAISGVGILIYQVMIYPFLVKHIGLSKPFRIAAVLSLSTLATYPFIANLYGYDYNCVQHSTDHHSDTRTKGCCKRYLTLMSTFKAAGPAAAGILFSWSQKNITGLFLPGDHILFLLLNMVALIGLALTFMPSFTMSTEMK
uniref:Uncharacterized protein n=1 Tax=Avena sativa TaxID=4498 RepID=A0ACD5VM89_AVESA